MPRPVKFRATAEKPAIGSLGLTLIGFMFWTFTWIGFRPVWMAERVGEQNLNA